MTAGGIAFTIFRSPAFAAMKQEQAQEHHAPAANRLREPFSAMFCQPHSQWQVIYSNRLNRLR